MLVTLDEHEEMAFSMAAAGDSAQMAEEEKTVMDATTVSYVQNHFGLPIWQAGVTMHVREAPLQMTIKASVEERDGRLVLKALGSGQPVTLAPLRHKLQWNFTKGSRRQPKLDESKAYQRLAARKRGAKASPFRVEVTGPLTKDAAGLVLEVRQFLETPGAYERQQE
jgi:hypothetical protein